MSCLGRGVSTLRSLPRTWTFDDAQKELDFYQLPDFSEFKFAQCPRQIHMMETDIANHIAKEMLGHLAKISGTLILRSSVQFLVWFREDDRSKFNVILIDEEQGNVLPAKIVHEISKLGSVYQKYPEEWQEKLPRGGFRWDSGK